MAKRRPAGDGMVRRRDDGRWEGRIVIGHRENGEPLFRHVYAKTQKALLDKLHQNIECYRDVELTEDSRMTLGEWLDRWLAEYKAGTVRSGTLEGYRRYIEYYCFRLQLSNSPNVLLDQPIVHADNGSMLPICIGEALTGRATNNHINLTTGLL